MSDENDINPQTIMSDENQTNQSPDEVTISPERMDRFTTMPGDMHLLTPEEAARVMTPAEALAKSNKEMFEMGLIDADGNEIDEPDTAE